jgi:hypothetical protein
MPADAHADDSGVALHRGNAVVGIVVLVDRVWMVEMVRVLLVVVAEVLDLVEALVVVVKVLDLVAIGTEIDVLGLVMGTRSPSPAFLLQIPQ